jgi:hypothetical protein
MATWATPRTWVTGEVVTAAQMNEQVRDNTTFSKEMSENAMLGVIFDGSGADIATDADYTIPVPGAATITGAVLRADDGDSLNTSDDQGDNIIVDVYRQSDSDGDNAFDSDDEIIAGILTLDSDSGIYARFTADSDWTTALVENDLLLFKVSSCTGVTKCSVGLLVHKG